MEQRGEWPAFSEKGNNEHMTTRRSAALHKQLTTRALGEALGAIVTIHWWRVTLATSLFAKGKPPGEIQALVRWKTEEAMRIYARIRPSAYADAVEGAIATPMRGLTRGRSMTRRSRSTPATPSPGSRRP